jgi:hypothetical protein
VPCSRSARRVAVRGGLQFLRPCVVGLGEPPHLIGTQTEVKDHRAGRLAVVDRVEELLLPHLYGEPRLRLPPEAGPRGVVLGLVASGAATSLTPRNSAVGYLRATSATLRIGLVADLMQLLQLSMAVH